MMGQAIQAGTGQERIAEHVRPLCGRPIAGDYVELALGVKYLATGPFLGSICLLR
jgi:hypothetical protein